MVRSRVVRLNAAERSAASGSGARVRVLQVGLGPIGVAIGRMAAARSGLQLVGAVDLRRDLSGRELEDVLGVPCRGQVCDDLDDAIERCAPDVAVVATVSELGGVLDDCETLLRRGVAVVSTCEEMAYPFIRRAAMAARLDEAARAGGAACLGTGINPGFVLDFLPVALSGPMAEVRAVRAFRVVDAALRREPLQRKIGAGLSRDEFAARVAAGGFGHRGLPESVDLLCAALGFDAGDVAETIEPVIAARAVDTGAVAVAAGRVAGIHQTAEGAGGRVRLDLRMFVGAEEPRDRIEIDGDPPVRATIERGYHGDVATCALALNAIAPLLAAPPGLRSMLDVAVPRWRA